MTTPAPGDFRRDVPYVVPSWSDPVVRLATSVVGGPTGRYAVVGARGLVGVAVTLVLLGSAVLALGVWQKGHCLMKGWSTPDQFWRACYSDLPVVHVSSPLAERALPWSGAAPSDQPPLSGLAMWLVAQVSPSAGQGLGPQQWVFALWALAATLLLALAVVAAVGLQPHRPWQAAHLAVSPVLVTLALVSTDLLGVALTLAGLWAWRRDRAWTGGALLGLATLVRPFPLVFVIAIVLVAWRLRQPLPAARVVVGALLAALAVVVPLVLVEPQALTGAQRWWSQGAGYGALQMVPALNGLHLPSELTVGLAVGGWVAGAALAGWVVSRPWRRVLAVHQVAALVMLLVVLTAPSLSVQSGLWVLPFLALSSRPWGEHLVWAGAETLHFVMTWLHIAFASDPGRGLPASTYSLVVLLRVAAWAWVLWRVAQEPPDGPVRARRGRVWRA
ncbi:glycosyltransferase 87 family protein [Ornithinimicrobium tianjinense]|uniref:Membrane protein n=1 Tax=Ornithinimicrobium tianjinense TaxID=1195761 RepID=A0A917BQR9_9MICO|nr:glycosyltransferase 87 family protein [Ornithinimicrobium tianjinense]GGF52923.1 membrane protein [Ornithinimicrobium tianjinense]